jgi:uncharacterized protein DUF2336
MVREIGLLFVEGATTFSEGHIQFFDEVFIHLAAEIESRARFELSVMLAGIANAPREIVRQLANDGDGFVASPILQCSRRLKDSDLLDVAKNQSQQHLLAIANRNQIVEAVTDVLVRRGDRDVVRNVAGNLGARLSLSGFFTLVRKAEKDGILAEKVGQRSDIPDPLLRALFVQATQMVQKRLLTSVTSETQAKIQRVLSELSCEDGIDISSHSKGVPRTPETIERREPQLNETALAKLASEGCHEEIIRSMSILCRISVEKMRHILGNKRADPALVVCKALGFGWQTARAIILLQAGVQGMSAHSLEIKNRNFEKLSISGSQDVMRLWHKMFDDQPSNRYSIMQGTSSEIRRPRSSLQMPSSKI